MAILKGLKVSSLNTERLPLSWKVWSIRPSQSGAPLRIRAAGRTRHYLADVA
jgi:hypothetical protein